MKRKHVLRMLELNLKYDHDNPHYSVNNRPIPDSPSGQIFSYSTKLALDINMEVTSWKTIGML